MFASEFSVNDQWIGVERPPFIVAEISGNHGGSLDRALHLIAAAKHSGADAVKFQLYTPDSMTLKSDQPEFQIPDGPWAGSSLYDLYARAQTPRGWFPQLFDMARKMRINAFASPFSPDEVDFLESLSCPMYKVASSEIVDLELISSMAATQKPIIISTGMANLKEVKEAVSAVQEAGNNRLVLLHCVASYPTNRGDAHLARIPRLAKEFGVPVGFSDHSQGVDLAQIAIALGACLVEKHFTIDSNDGGVDSFFSSTPREFYDLVNVSREVRLALGDPEFRKITAESTSLLNRRSVFVCKDVAAGETLTDESLRVVRPGHGIAPKMLPQALGAVATRDLMFGEPLTLDMFTHGDQER